MEKIIHSILEVDPGDYFTPFCMFWCIFIYLEAHDDDNDNDCHGDDDDYENGNDDDDDDDENNKNDDDEGGNKYDNDSLVREYFGLCTII